jgi:hypothetical protein
MRLDDDLEAEITQRIAEVQSIHSLSGGGAEVLMPRTRAVPSKQSKTKFSLTDKKAALFREDGLFW